MTTRRTFIRGLAVSAAGVGIAGCSSPGQSNSASGESSGDGGESSGSSDDSGGDGGSGSEFVEATTVDMTDELGFEPKQVKVEAGTTLTFKNVGSIGHTVTAYEDKIPDGATYFASGGYESEQAAKDAYGNEQGGNIPKGESYEVTLETKGTYEYYCIPHEMNGMVGTIKVV